MLTQHAKVSVASHSLVVQTNEDTLRIPIDDIQVLLIGTTQVMISAAAIAALAEGEAKVIFCGRDGQPITETVNEYSSRQSLQTIQKQNNWNQNRIEIMWTSIVSEKITNQIQVLNHLGLDGSNLGQELDALELNDITNREAVVARRYFQQLFGPNFSRDDFDPRNDALNYGYSILLSAINREIVANGYLTALGIHHYNQNNLFNLGSDLMEPFRPIVDQFVYTYKFSELTPDVKFGLVDLLNLEMTINGRQAILRNAVAEHVNRCLRYLSGELDEFEIEVNIPNEVSSHAINDHV
ncbi:CRISPR-associated protein Cas1 [Lacticaseibacillus saniviri JCM 17471 = DSM 24301]|uniref:CRISPR-associated endonuclease Cas1 n=2 Tax=Lacticaseibacillus saniviri TaxID=931533 RepID=A0A0R2N4P9_9LACO|nr:CRISPR-associated protein Cas1 [Lacticaseibacillus saniviri JCM 17471 = DSM 24301]